jgi:DNA-binding XRE family transcriptional regulator
MAKSENNEERHVVLAQNIKDARIKKDLSQEVLAAMVGVSTDTIRKIEQKHRQ